MHDDRWNGPRRRANGKSMLCDAPLRPRIINMFECCFQLNALSFAVYFVSIRPIQMAVCVPHSWEKLPFCACATMAMIDRDSRVNTLLVEEVWRRKRDERTLNALTSILFLFFFSINVISTRPTSRAGASRESSWSAAKAACACAIYNLIGSMTSNTTVYLFGIQTPIKCRHHTCRLRNHKYTREKRWMC